MVKRCSLVSCSIFFERIISSLQSTITQNLKAKSLQPLSKESLQILNVNSNHWIIVSTGTCNKEIDIYDSLHSSLSKTTQQLVTRLVHTQQKRLAINMCKFNKPML